MAEVKDAFLDAGIDNIIKKAELEAVTEELESAEYREAHPGEEDIYGEVEGPLSFDKLTEPPKTIEELKERREEKDNESKEAETKYNGQKPTEPNDVQTQMISFNDQMTEYIENKGKIRTIKNNIEAKTKEVRSVIDNLNNTEGLNKEEIKVWFDNYEKYHKLCIEIDKIFQDRIEELKEKNNVLFKSLTDNIQKFEQVKKIYVAIYDSSRISQLFGLLKNNLDQILDTNKYTKLNEFMNQQLDIDTSTVETPTVKKPVISQKKISTLRSENKKLQGEITKLKGANYELQSDLRHLREVELELLSSQKQIERLETIQEEPTNKDTKKAELDTRLETIQGELELKYNAEISRLKKKIESLNESKEKNNALLEENQRKIEDLTAQYKKEREDNRNKIAGLKEDYDKTNQELEIKIQGLKGKSKELNVQKVMLLETKLKITRGTPDFFPLMLKSANLYLKQEPTAEPTADFNASIDELLKYQPMNEFMFKDIFTSIESGFENYGYMDEFITSKKIPDKIYGEQIFQDTKTKLSPYS